MTGIRRSGKSCLLRTLFKKNLLENGVDYNHIIEMSFDLFESVEYRDPKVFYPWAKNRLRMKKSIIFFWMKYS